MTTSAAHDARILGSVRAVDGIGAVRVEDRFDTAIDDLWSALTEPRRLVRWLGEVDGDLRSGGEFRAHFYASGWEGSGRIEACEPPRRLLLQTWEKGEQAHDLEVTLRPDGEHIALVVEERGMPLDQVGAYGAGTQVHVEDLAAHLAGRERCDAQARWAELAPAYEALAADIDEIPRAACGPTGIICDTNCTWASWRCAEGR